MACAEDEHEAPLSKVVSRFRHIGSFLVYLLDYQLVICKSCKFALQPSAISSHLLRHQIYREKRQNLLDRVAKLHLLEPDQVSLPSEVIPAIPHLPVAAGHRCGLPSCGHLCISHKRMTQHLRERHAHVDSAKSVSRSCHVYLQTFFKGNKVRYFEVEPSKTDAIPDSTRQSDRYRFVNGSDLEENSSPGPPLGTEQCPLLHRTPETQLQIGDLLYMHHYTTVTGLSLTRGTEHVSFWTHDLPLQAANQPFLLHGILGVAAFHQAVLASDPDVRRQHQSAGLQHQSAGLATFRTMVDRPTPETSVALTTFARLLGVQNCAQALLEADGCSQTDHVEGANISEVLECMQLLRGGLELLLSMQSLLPADSALLLSNQVLDGLHDLEFGPEMPSKRAIYLANEFNTHLISPGDFSSPRERITWLYSLETLAAVRQYVRFCVSVSDMTCMDGVTDDSLKAVYPGQIRSNIDVQYLKRTLTKSRDSAEQLYRKNGLREETTPSPLLSCYPSLTVPLRQQLCSLPRRLMAMTHRPSTTEIKAFDQAMAALVSCFSRYYAADAVWARWNGIESWPRMLSDHFVAMIGSSHALALTLVAHWLYMFEMQEKHYWFLRGRSQRMMRIVLHNLNPTMQAFVQDRIASLPEIGSTHAMWQRPSGLAASCGSHQ